MSSSRSRSSLGRGRSRESNGSGAITSGGGGILAALDFAPPSATKKKKKKPPPSMSSSSLRRKSAAVPAPVSSQKQHEQCRRRSSLMKEEAATFGINETENLPPDDNQGHNRNEDCNSPQARKNSSLLKSVRQIKDAQCSSEDDSSSMGSSAAEEEKEEVARVASDEDEKESDSSSLSEEEEEEEEDDDDDDDAEPEESSSDLSDAEEEEEDVDEDFSAESPPKKPASSKNELAGLEGIDVNEEEDELEDGAYEPDSDDDDGTASLDSSACRSDEEEDDDDDDDDSSALVMDEDDVAMARRNASKVIHTPAIVVSVPTSTASASGSGKGNNSSSQNDYEREEEDDNEIPASPSSVHGSEAGSDGSSQNDDETEDEHENEFSENEIVEAMVLESDEEDNQEGCEEVYAEVYCSDAEDDHPLGDLEDDAADDRAVMEQVHESTMVEEDENDENSSSPISLDKSTFKCNATTSVVASPKTAPSDTPDAECKPTHSLAISADAEKSHATNKAIVDANALLQSNNLASQEKSPFSCQKDSLFPTLSLVSTTLQDDTLATASIQIPEQRKNAQEWDDETLSADLSSSDQKWEPEHTNGAPLPPSPLAPPVTCVEFVTEKLASLHLPSSTETKATEMPCDEEATHNDPRDKQEEAQKKLASPMKTCFPGKSLPNTDIPSASSQSPQSPPSRALKTLCLNDQSLAPEQPTFEVGSIGHHRKYHPSTVDPDERVAATSEHHVVDGADAPVSCNASVGPSNQLLMTTTPSKSARRRRPRVRDHHRSRSEGIVKPGTWTLGSKIGKGAFGVVHVGMNTKTGTLMAVKSIKMDSAIMKDVRREIDLLRLLDHKNIVRYYGAEKDSTHLRIFQEWVPGGSLTELLSKFGPFTLPVIRNYLRQTLQGLAYLHENDIMHRDMKGSNILVNDQGVVKLADFGGSKKMAELQSGMMMSMTVRGTPYFMAPEVFEEKYSYHADIWGIGCVAFQMIDGEAPWSNLGFTNPVSLFNHVKKQNGPPPLDALQTDTESLLFKAMLHKCFDPVPGNRPDCTTLLLDSFFSLAESTSEDEHSIDSERGLFSPATPQSFGIMSPIPRKSGLRRSCSASRLRSPLFSPPLPKHRASPARQLLRSPLPGGSPRPDSSNWPSWARKKYEATNSSSAARAQAKGSDTTRQALLASMDSLAFSADTVPQPPQSKGDTIEVSSTPSSTLVGVGLLSSGTLPESC